MRVLAPVALTGVASIILWKILQILLAPVTAWIIGMLALVLKIVVVVALASLAAYGVRRMMQSRAEGKGEA